MLSGIAKPSITAYLNPVVFGSLGYSAVIGSMPSLSQVLVIGVYVAIATGTNLYKNIIYPGIYDGV